MSDESRLERQISRNLQDINDLKTRIKTLEGHVDFYLLGDPSGIKDSTPPPKKETPKTSRRPPVTDDRVVITIVGNKEVAKVKKFLTDRNEFMELSEKLSKIGFTYFKEAYWKDSRWERPLQR